MRFVSPVSNCYYRNLQQILCGIGRYTFLCAAGLIHLEIVFASTRKLNVSERNFPVFICYGLKHIPEICINSL